VDLANERGGSDNITVIVARYEQSMASDQQPTLRLPNALRIC
jgi:serine/threonine protein phosphatase PrpC